MPDRLYELITEAPRAAAFTQAINDCTAAVLRLDAACDKVTPKLKELGKGASRNINSAGKAVNGLATNMADAKTKADALAVALANGAGAAKTFGGSMNLAGSHAHTAGLSLGRFTAAGIGMMAARKVFSEVMEESRKLEEYWQRLAKEATEFRESLREFASIRGEGKGVGVKNEDIGMVLDLAVATHMSKEKAKALANEWANFAPAVKAKGHIAPADKDVDKLEREMLADTGNTARRLGIEEGAAGMALGSAGLFSKFTTREQASEQVGGALQGLARGSVHYTPGLKALNIAAAKLVDTEEAAAEGALPGKVGSYSQAGTFLGALSLGTGGKAHTAGHQMVQISRALNPDATLPDAQKALKQAGLTDQMDDVGKLVQLSKFMKAKKIADPKRWLSERKVGSQATRDAVIAGMKQADILEKWLAEAKESEKTNAAGKLTLEKNTEFRRTDRTALAAGADAAKEVMDTVEGVEGPEVFEAAKKVAEERIRQGMNQQTYTGILPNAIRFAYGQYVQPNYGIGGVQGFEKTRELGAIAKLRAEAKRVKADISPFEKDLESGHYIVRSRAFTGAYEAVKAAGGDPIGQEAMDAQVKARIEGMRKVPIGRPVGPGGVRPAAAPGLPGLPGLPLPTSSLGGADNGALTDINRRQLSRLDELVALARGPRSPRANGPLPVDGGDFGPRRDGVS